MPAGLGEPLPQASKGCVYLDYNATTPIFPEVAATMQPYLTEHFGNASSVHTYGRAVRACTLCTCNLQRALAADAAGAHAPQGKAGVDRARQQVASLIRAHPDEIVFTSCGTESDNLAIYSSVMAARAAWRRLERAGENGVGGGAPHVPHVVCSAVEHPAVLKHLQHLQDQVRWLLSGAERVGPVCSLTAALLSSHVAGSSCGPGRTLPWALLFRDGSLAPLTVRSLGADGPFLARRSSSPTRLCPATRRAAWPSATWL